MLRHSAGLFLLAIAIPGLSGMQVPRNVLDRMPDIGSVQPDLMIPPLADGAPAAGRRVRQTLPEFAGTDLHHVLYLPRDWRKGKRYPVLIEYPGNGPYHNSYGDVCTGEMEDCRVGYGISGGKRFIWACAPFVNSARDGNQKQWWGDPASTVDYAKKLVSFILATYGGDPSAVILTGFSRGAIACNYIGMYDDEIAGLWRAFIPFSHYDGVKQWNYAGSDRASALQRLKRLRGRPVFICQEGSVDSIRDYLASTGVPGRFAFQPIPFRNHSDMWVLRDIPERGRLRAWLKAVLRKQPGEKIKASRSFRQEHME
jgi:hypothetical protein